MKLFGIRWLVALGGGLIALALPAVIGLAWERSRLPDTYNVMQLGFADLGGGSAVAHGGGHGAHGHGGHGQDRVSVADLKETASGPPDFRATLTARTSRIRLASGKEVDGLTFDGQLPGPELRLRQHDLVEITLVNEDVERGVAIHWHGVDLPNAEDGVAGVTQDAVLPGERYTYRFRVPDAGTYWYHSHQASAEQVEKGLYGAFVVAPRDAEPEELDLTLFAHRLGGKDVLGASDVLERRAVAAGTAVRLRLVNSSDFPKRFVLGGVPFRVAAIDGTDVNEPGLLRREVLEVAAGGRYDVTFSMPAAVVRLDLVGSPAGLLLSPDGSGELAPASVTGRPSFDPAVYGEPRRTPFGPGSRFDRSFRLDIGDKIGFHAGGFGRQWTMNGATHASMPMLLVREGELVKVTVSSSTKAVHPMHLHGHHMLVLSRNGVPARGSPWWVDTLDVKRGETYELAFRADNPGLWMFHCHNLVHAAEGLGTHVVYEGVYTPFVVGGRARNQPE